jgi:glycosyltransferase involved in cell wall biosynthesis
MISVIMPLFNHENFVARAIKSVLSQTFACFEVIVVNDGSTDSSASIVNQFTDERILLVDQPNQGVSAARNTGIRHAKFGLIAFLDSDDEWFSTYLEHIYMLHRKYPDCAVYATRYQVRKNQKSADVITLNGVGESFLDGVIENYFEICAHSDPLLWSSATAVKKEALLNVGGFPVGWKSGEDLITWARLACRYKIAFCNKTLSTYHFNRPDRETPKRKPDIPDLVGKELNKLRKSNNLVGMSRYLGWYKKNRAIHFFESGDRLNCLLSAVQSFVFTSLSLRSFQLLLLPVVPRRFYFNKKFINEDNNNRRR